MPATKNTTLTTAISREGRHNNIIRVCGSRCCFVIRSSVNGPHSLLRSLNNKTQRDCPRQAALSSFECDTWAGVWPNNVLCPEHSRGLRCLMLGCPYLPRLVYVTVPPLIDNELLVLIVVLRAADGGGRTLLELVCSRVSASSNPLANTSRASSDSWKGRDSQTKGNSWMACLLQIINIWQWMDRQTDRLNTWTGCVWCNCWQFVPHLDHNILFRLQQAIRGNLGKQYSTFAESEKSAR